jgi:hypothetical protein
MQSSKNISRNTDRRNITKKSSKDPEKPVDLDLHWDPIAQKIAESYTYTKSSSGLRRFEDYFDFLADIEPSQMMTKEELTGVSKRKFEL